LIYLYRLCTECIIELGSWLGRSAEYFARSAPNALIFAVDLWDNAVILADKHYCGNPENLAILNVGPLYDRFMSNMWEYKLRVVDGKPKGILPMRMDAMEALRVLKRAGVEPDLVYVDASHHYDGVYRDIKVTLELFPRAHIVGDDFDYPDVRRAVEQCATEYNLEIFVAGNKCWTYSRNYCLERRHKRAVEEEKEEHADSSASWYQSLSRPPARGIESVRDLMARYKRSKTSSL
jgi:hypothetical protein